MNSPLDHPSIAAQVATVHRIKYLWPIRNTEIGRTWIPNTLREQAAAIRWLREQYQLEWRREQDELQSAIRINTLFDNILTALGVTDEQLEALPEEVTWSYRTLIDTWKGENSVESN